MLKVSSLLVYVFLYYMICISFYILYEKIKLKREEKKIKQMSDTLNGIFKERVGELDKKRELIFKGIVKRNLKFKWFGEFIINECRRNKLILNYMKQIYVIDIIKIIEEEDELDIAYKLKLIGELEVDYDIHELYRYLECDSLYIQVNSLKAISAKGNAFDFVNGIKKVLSNKSVMDEKLILQIMRGFKGDRGELNEALIKEIDRGERELILYFITLCRVDGDRSIYKFVLELLNNYKLTLEERIACIKYLGLITCKEVREELLEFTFSKDDEVRAVSCEILGNYNDSKVKVRLRELLKDESADVRRECAKSIYKLTGNKFDLRGIIGEDKNEVMDEILSLVSEEMDLVDYLCRMGNV
ncbi:MAG: HEAT repeat domain-containing protein [Clostridium sp.]